MVLPLLFLLAASAPSGPPPYADSLRCAAYSRAAWDLAEGTEREDRAFDRAIFWGLATMEAARRDGVTAKAAEADQARERVKVRALLAEGDATALAALDACLEQVPDVIG